MMKHAMFQFSRAAVGFPQCLFTTCFAQLSLECLSFPPKFSFDLSPCDGRAVVNSCYCTIMLATIDVFLYILSEGGFLGRTASSASISAGNKMEHAVPNQEWYHASSPHNTKFSLCHTYTKQGRLFCRKRMSWLTKSRVPHFPQPTVEL